MSYTEKKEKFAQKFVELGNASDAYRASYNASNMKVSTINKRASELLKDGYVTGRIEELREQHAQRHNVTVDSLTEEPEEARGLAIKTEQTSSAVSATMGKAKLHGLLIEKQENLNVDLTISEDDKDILEQWRKGS